MYLEIKEKFCPFSHLPGTSFVLPLSALSLEIFPTLIRIKNLQTVLPIVLSELEIHLRGPIKDFTVIQELDRGVIRVFGESALGYFRYSIKALKNDEGIEICVEKVPSNGLELINNSSWVCNQKKILEPGEKIFFSKHDLFETQLGLIDLPLTEKLFLGNHKSLDWELVKRRFSFNEIFPVWYQLGQLVSLPLSHQLAGTAHLLKNCEQAIAANSPDKILDHFYHLFSTSFDGILSPRLMDTNFLGISYPLIDSNTFALDSVSSLTILVEGVKLIRSLFVKESEQDLTILPQLPPQFFCGQMVAVRCGIQGVLSMEWSKKSIRRMTFSALENQKITFSFSNHEKKCRLRSSFKDRGKDYIPHSQIDIVAGQDYWFDNFER